MLQVDVLTFLVTPTAYSNASLMVDFTQNTAFPKFLVDISEFNPFTKTYVATSGWSNQQVTLSNSYIVLLGQTPGKCLKVSSIPYDNSGALSTQNSYLNNFMRVTCGCPDPSPSNLYMLLATEGSGSPTGFSVVQSYGKLYMLWTDRSLCESGFSFTRGGAQFTSTYAIQVPQVCGLAHAPTSVYDDLVSAQKQGQANPGTLQTYCVRAVNPIGCDLGSYSSDPTCIVVIINWESAIFGSVTGTFQIGSPPVEGVTIRWQAVDYPDLVGYGTTNIDGKIVETDSNRLGINIQSPLLIGQVKILVGLSKQSGPVAHNFLCNFATPCTSQNLTLQNLDFGANLQFYDTSVVVLSGLISIANTAAFNGGSGLPCYVPLARVCAKSFTSHAILGCNTTDIYGRYSLTVAMGLAVVLEVEYHNHTFSRVSNTDVDRLAQYGIGYTGIGNEPAPVEYFNIIDASIGNLNYEDTTTVTINIELAGGNCNRTLGNAFIHLTRDLCPSYVREINIQAFQTPVVIPADLFVVNFDRLTTGNVNFDLEVERYLHVVHPGGFPIDCRNVSSEMPDIFTTVRFEYHPTPSLRASFSNTAPPECTDPLAKRPQWVMPSLLMTDLTVYAEELFPGLLSCTDVSGNITITSFVGENVADGVLAMCRTGCLLPLMGDTVTSKDTNVTYKFNSRAMVSLVVGYPLLFNPFVKNVFVRLSLPGHADTTLELPVIVTGLKHISDSFSVQLPHYQPLLVLHDPPGGDSVASYTNQKYSSTLSATHADYEDSFVYHTEISVGGGTDTSACAGAIVLYVCQGLVHLDIGGGAVLDGKVGVVKGTASESSATITFEFTYETSPQPDTAGINSTMYLMPALNVVYSKSRKVSFDATLCMATYADITTWSLTSPKNFQVFAWKSYRDILGFILPAFNGLLTEQQSNLAANVGSSSDTLARIAKLQESITGWQGLIDYRNNIESLARTGGLPAVKNLVPDSLLTNVKTLSGEAASSTPIKEIAAFSFGGEAHITYLEQNDNEASSTASSSVVWENYIGLAFHISADILVVTAEFQLELGYFHAQDVGSENTKIAGGSTGRSFTLGDPDQGDQFDIQVFRDPAFQSLFFLLRSGVSRCPWEVGTVTRTNVGIGYTHGDGTAIGILPDEPAIFEVDFQVTPDVDDEFGNDYIIYQDMNSGNKGLRVYVDGQPVNGVLTFAGLYYGSYTKTVEIHRGPSAYVYSPVNLNWEPLCDGDHFSVTIPFTVSFVQTCARAEFHPS